MKLNLGSGGFPLPGFENLDKLTGWRFESELPYPDGSVEAVTWSHFAMYVPLPDWPALYREVARVLVFGGRLRVTEDATDDPRSERFGGHPDAVTLTSANLVLRHMVGARLHGRVVSADEGDRTLMQDRHGGSPKCFFVEGVKR